LIRRYKRFLADVTLADGTELTVHTPNTGAMLGCSEPGSRVWLRDSANPKRKYRYAWEMSEVEAGALVGVNTGLVTALVEEGIDTGRIGELQGYESRRREVPYGVERSRIDILLQDTQRGQCFVEIKNVTAKDPQGLAFFPDAKTVRGTKHLRELIQQVREGHRAVLLFCVQRNDVHAVRPADEIDPLYGQTLREALSQGVEVLAYQAQLSPGHVALTTALPVHC
jgi:sugar fermentation stimulation protein A